MSTLLYEKRDGVATITFNRPQARNALTPEMLCRLADAVRDFEADGDVRVAVVTGVGDRAFYAGGDLATTLPLLTGKRLPFDEWDRRFLEDPQVSAASSLRNYSVRKPVIAAVNGACLAAGMGADAGSRHSRRSGACDAWAPGGHTGIASICRVDGPPAAPSAVLPGHGADAGRRCDRRR